MEKDGEGWRRIDKDGDGWIRMEKDGEGQKRMQEDGEGWILDKDGEECKKGWIRIDNDE